MLGSLSLPHYITVYLHYIKKKKQIRIPSIKYMYIRHQVQGDLDLLGASKYHCSTRNN